MPEEKSTVPPTGEGVAASPPIAEAEKSAATATSTPTAGDSASTEQPASDVPDPAVDLAMQNEQTVAQTNAINDAISASQVRMRHRLLRASCVPVGNGGTCGFEFEFVFVLTTLC